MSATSSTAAPKTDCPLKAYFVPYYLTWVAVLGGITAVFAAVVLIMVLVVTNFNLLGWME